MKYLLCGLNDENYTMPSFKVFDNITEAMECAHKWCIAAFVDDYIWCDIETKVSGDYFNRNCRKTIRNEDEFFVTEVKTINEDVEYVAVWHHAYDGVDFKVIAQGTKEECIKAIDDDMRKLIEDLDLDESDYDGNTIDTGTEWEHWEIVKVN